MPHYRFYLVGPAERLEPVEAFQAGGDQEAVTKAAHRRLNGRAAELWEGGRRVGRFSKMGVFSEG